MADIQKQFELFHKRVRVDYEMSTTLRDKRDIILNRIRSYLKQNGLPGFDELLQGSFAAKTGVIPIEDLEYDIDVGLRFAFDETKYTAAQVRDWVYKAVEGHTEKVEAKGPCIRVTYADGYHVDLVAYAVWQDDFGNRHFRLAHKDRGWRKADPIALRDEIDRYMKPYEDTEDSYTQTNQFRRVVRYLRRWSDEALPEESHDKITGLGFILLASKYLRPKQKLNGDPDDLSALQAFVSSLGNVAGRLEARKPTPEYDDVLAKVSDQAMTDWKARLTRLAADLSKAATEPDPIKACELVKKHLGRDFPVPTPEETGKKTSAPAIVTASSSA